MPSLVAVRVSPDCGSPWLQVQDRLRTVALSQVTCAFCVALTWGAPFKPLFFIITIIITLTN